MTTEQQILELNTYVKTHLAPSSVQGVGVFALRDIKKGDKLYADMMPRMYTVPYEEFKKLYPTVRKELLAQFPLIVKGSAFAYPTTRIMAYMNHSDDPNYDAVNDVVLRPIKSGEEIFEDYRLIDTPELFDFIKV